VPAAAVIPAPIAYIKVVAVKKLVVGFLPRTTDRPIRVCVWFDRGILLEDVLQLTLDTESRTFTLRKLECFKQAFAVNTLAWNNKIGLRFYFVGF
jgi:hypothetical protein